MNIIHNGSIVEAIDYKDRQSIVDRLQFWFSSIAQSERVVHEVIIDGNDVTGNFQNYIMEHSDKIESIHIGSITQDEMFDHTMQMLIQYSKNMESACETLSDMLYAEPTEQTWGLLEQFTVGLQFVLDSCQALRIHMEHKNSNHPMYEILMDTGKSMKPLIGEIESALLSNDYVNAADIIKYEIGERIEKLRSELESGDSA